MTENAYAGIETASRYDSARSLPPETLTVWIDALKSSTPGKVKRILDLGRGTGRFTSTLSKAFECPVIGIEPSKAMLSVARSQSNPNIEWKRGEADSPQATHD